MRLMQTIVLALLAFTPLLGGCSTNPATGRTQFDLLLPPAQEVAMGEQAQPQLTAEYGGAVPDEDLQHYLTQVGLLMTPHTEGDYPDLPWEFTLLDSDVINAFALPGGKVFVSRGLVQRFDNEAQLASVVGHEIGHVTARHINERLNRQYALQFGGSLLTAIASGGESTLAQLGVELMVSGAGVYALKFDRDQESEADALGIRYMTRAGYNPIGSLQSMKVLAAAAAEGGDRPAEMFSTHPYPETRVGRIETILRQQHPQALRSPEKDVYADRFRTRMLARLGALPAPADADAVALAGAGVWCGVCREQHAH